MRLARPVCLLLLVWLFGGVLPEASAQKGGGFTPIENVSSKGLALDLPRFASARLGTNKLRFGDYLRFAFIVNNGTEIIAGSNNKILRFSTATGRSLGAVNKAYVSFSELTASPNGKYIAFTSSNTYLDVWKTSTGTSYRRLNTNNPNHRMQRVVFSHDSKLVAGCPYDYYSSRLGNMRPVYVWNVESQQRYGPFMVPQTRYVRAAFSLDKKTLATFGNQGYSSNPAQKEISQMIQLWDIKTGKEIRKLKGNRGAVIDAAFTRDGKYLAALSGQSTVNLWDLKKEKVIRRFSGRSAFNGFIRFTPDDRYLMVGSSNGGIQVWNAKTWKRIIVNSPACNATSFSVTKNGRILGCGIDGQAICLWNVKTGKTIFDVTGHRHYLKSIQFRPDSKELLSMDQRGHICRWDAASGKLLKQTEIRDLEGASGYSANSTYYQTAISPSAKYLVSRYSNTIHLWHLPTKKLVCDFSTGSSYSSNQPGVAFSADSRKLVVVNYDTTVSVWDVTSGEELQLFRMAKKGKNQSNIYGANAAFSPHGRYVAVAAYYYDRNIGGRSVYKTFLWNVKTGKKIMENQHANNSICSVAFSPDGSKLAVGDYNAITLHSTATGKEERRWVHGQGQLAQIAFSPDGRTVAASSPQYVSSGSTLPIIQVWETATGDVRCKFGYGGDCPIGHDGPIFNLVYSPDGNYLASGSNDTSIILWDMSGRAAVRDASKLTTKELHSLWAGLTNANGKKSFATMGRFVNAGDMVVSFLSNTLKPTIGKRLNEKEIKTLISKLDHRKFRVRERAGHTLKNLGKRVLPYLLAALKSTNSAEVEERITKIVSKMEVDNFTPAQLREIRAVEILERINSKKSRQLLTHLSKGALGSPLTVHAGAALSRIMSKS